MATKSSKSKRAKANRPKSINLALQGGGAHGAFSWGVLDKLLACDDIKIEAISGTSAGAMNAVVLADGMMRGGREAARTALKGFWQAIAEAGEMSPMQRSPFDVATGNWSLDMSPAFMFSDFLSRLASPYDLNPLNYNPLQSILEERVNFELVRSCDHFKIFISATNVETGQVRVFDPRKLTCQMVMASACLPYVFQAVEIDGTPYWDGGYMGNPVLFPFHAANDVRDIVVVQINPIVRPGTPKTAREIMNRVNEISFNSSLLQEFRAIDFVHRLIDAGKLSEEDYKSVLIHVIDGDEQLRPLGAFSKLNPEWSFLLHLFEIGQAVAGKWIDDHFDKIGVQSSVDVRAMFAGVGAGRLA